MWTKSHSNSSIWNSDTPARYSIVRTPYCGVYYALPNHGWGFVFVLNLGINAGCPILIAIFSRTDEKPFCFLRKKNTNKTHIA